MRFIRDHDAVAVSRGGGLEDAAHLAERRPFQSGAVLDCRATETVATDRFGSAPGAGILAGRYTIRRTPEPGCRDTDRLVGIFALLEAALRAVRQDVG
jgi:hypothetical protein